MGNMAAPSAAHFRLTCGKHGCTLSSPQLLISGCMASKFISLNMSMLKKNQGSPFYLSVSNTQSDKIAEFLVSLPIKVLREMKRASKENRENDTQKETGTTKEIKK